MRAATVGAYGAAPEITDLPDQEPGPGQILIKVRAAGVNPMDRSIAEGQWQAMMPATFPLILGADVAGVVSAAGAGTTRFRPGDTVFGQLLIPPLGSAGTYADYVLVTEQAPLLAIPAQLDPVTAAALPTPAGAAVDLVESLGSLAGKTVLIVGAAGAVGSFATQLAARAGARVIASARAAEAARVRGYGAADTIDYTEAALDAEVARSHPDGIDVLIDLASDAPGFAALASLVRRGGTAVTSRYVADLDSIATAGVQGANFQVTMSAALLQRVADGVVSGRLTPPPIATIRLSDLPAIWSGSQPGGKTVIIP